MFLVAEETSRLSWTATERMELLWASILLTHSHRLLDYP
jgi:hypothetical protein